MPYEIEHADGALVVGGQKLSIPRLRIDKIIGRGANGVVFAARDDVLGRRVAVKVWNSRGQSRAQLEAGKIARINHPLVVTLHEFGVIGAGHRYSVMELIDGASGKDWMNSAPAFDERLAVWRMYSRALRYLHSLGVLHGDPHLGNLLVFADKDGAYDSSSRNGGQGIGAKLADIGTSEFWCDDRDFASREAALIWETAQRVFQPEEFALVAPAQRSLPYTRVLAACDQVVEFYSYVFSIFAYDRRAETASKLVEIALQTPILNLAASIARMRVSGLPERFTRRLNAKLLGIRDFMQASDHLEEEAERLYIERQSKWINSGIL